MSLPAPRPGLVICYSYLWATEHRKGADEGRKNRPCAIVAAHQILEGKDIVTVLPITHTPPTDPNDAVEIPVILKTHLHLDDFPSWIIVTETNDFIWPGADLQPVPGSHPRRFRLWHAAAQFLRPPSRAASKIDSSASSDPCETFGLDKAVLAPHPSGACPTRVF